MENVVKIGQDPTIAQVQKDSKAVDLTSPPPAKKYKQARLPFKVLSPKPVSSLQISPSTQKKRKLSDPTSGQQKASKAAKNDANSPKNLPKKVKNVEDAENEVSSSSEADPAQKGNSTTETKPKPISLLDKFVRTTQQLEVSTSGAVVDLTESDNEAEGRDVSKVLIEDSSMPTESNNICGEKEKKNGSSTTESSTIEKEDDEEPGSTKENDTEEGVANDAKNTESATTKENQNIEEDVTDKDAEKVPEEDVAADSSDKTEDKLNSSMNETSAPEKTSASEDDEDADKSANSISDNMDSPNAQVESHSTDTKRRPKPPPSSVTAAEKNQRKAQEALRLEKQRQRDAEKLEKEKQKKEEKDRKEQERIEAKQKKDEEKQRQMETKQKEKEEKLKQKEEEKQKKNQEKEDERKKKLQEKEEEKKKKQELMESKNEGKNKKDEEKQKAEEKLRLKQEKEKNAFSKFFTKEDKKPLSAQKPSAEKAPFVEFQVKKDMRLASINRVNERTRQEKMEYVDRFMQEEVSQLYLDELRGKVIKPGRSEKTWPYERDLDVVIEAPEGSRTMRAKFLRFKENYRPPYYGTWRKKSKLIGPRCPLSKDEGLLDYEVDSDEEWEEEEPGESLSDSGGEEEEKGADTTDGDGDNEEDEDGFFVPHGYLSDGEGCEDEEGEDTSPERLKARQLAKAKAWDVEMSKDGQKCVVLRPVCIGCCFWGMGTGLERDPTWEKLQQLAAVPLLTVPIRILPQDSTDTPSPRDASDKKKNGLKAMKVPEEAMPDLARLVHGNVCSFRKLVKEFLEYWHRKSLGLPLINEKEAQSVPSDSGNQSEEAMDTSQTEEVVESNDDKYTISKRQLCAKIKQMAVYERRSDHRKICWYVNEDVLQKHGLTDLPIPTKWHWITRPNTPPGASKQVKDTGAPTPQGTKKPQAVSTPNIKQFAVAGYTPPIVAPSPKINSTLNDGKLSNDRTPQGTKKSQAVSTPNIKQFAVPGYTPPIVAPSPKIDSTLNDGKLSNDRTRNPSQPSVEMLLSTPKSATKTTSSETPKRVSEQNLSTPPVVINVSPDSASTVQSDDVTPVKIKSTGTPKNNQRSLVAMFSSPPPQKASPKILVKPTSSPLVVTKIPVKPTSSPRVVTKIPVKPTSSPRVVTKMPVKPTSSPLVVKPINSRGDSIKNSVTPKSKTGIPKSSPGLEVRPGDSADVPMEID